MKQSSDIRLRSIFITLMAVTAIGLFIREISTLMLDRPHTSTTSKESLTSGLSQRFDSDQQLDQKIQLHFQQAVMMLHANEYEYAIVALQKTLELAPQMPEAHVNMGYALLGLERHSLARQYFSTAIDLRPDQANAYWGLAISLEEARDYDAAIGAMRTYIHLSDPAAPYQVKAQAAIWEWDELRKRLASE